MSPLSDRSGAGASSGGATNGTAATPGGAGGAAGSTSSAANGVVAPLETMRHLQTVSHRGYGAPVASWNGTHSALSRQVNMLLCFLFSSFYFFKHFIAFIAGFERDDQIKKICNENKT